MHSRFLSRSSLAVAILVAGACASGSGGHAAEPSVAEQAASGALGPAMLRWSGKFKSVQQQSGGIDPRGRNVASGTVLLTAPNDKLTRAQISISGPVEGSQMLHWAIAPGACLSGSIPLLAVNEFPEIHMSNGHGDLDQTVPIALPTSGSYHVNIYTGNGQDESDVLTCAELSLGRR